MNGTSRLYRSTSEATIGGVAAGLGNYFHVDPTFIRVAFVLLTIATGGAFAFVYLALWLLLPTAGSTATDPNQIIQENVSEMGARFRSFVGGTSYTPGQGTGNPNPGNMPNGGNPGNGGNGAPAPSAQYNQAQTGQPGQPGQQVPPTQPGMGAGYQARPGIGPMILIVIGSFFLLASMGFFRYMHFGGLLPLLLIAFGVIMLMRRRP